MASQELPPSQPAPRESADIFCCDCGVVMVGLNYQADYLINQFLAQHLGAGHQRVSLEEGMQLTRQKLARTVSPPSPAQRAASAAGAREP